MGNVTFGVVGPLGAIDQLVINLRALLPINLYKTMSWGVSEKAVGDAGSQNGDISP